MPFAGAAKFEKEGEVDRVYRLLKSWILDCHMRPGEFLSEVDLARQCETSRTPIREACNLLSQERWIQRIRHKGYVIPPISVREIVEVYEYRKLLECFTADRAAKEAATEEIIRLKAITELENRPITDVKLFLEANERFHMTLAEMARNQRVYDHLKLTLEYVHRLDILSTQRDTRAVPHGDIVRAIEAHHSSDAAKAMAAHIDISRDRMLKLFGS
jgi:DNA-binding GntR family transcriptional regulator